jgi:hypothetical protein
MANERCRRHEGELCRGKDGTLRVSTPIYIADLPPSTKSFPGPKYSQDARFKATVRYLDRVSIPTISRLEVLALSKFLHDVLVYAIHFQTGGRFFATQREMCKAQRRPLQELKRLRKAAVKKDLKKIQLLMSNLSEQCLTLITGSDEHPVLEFAIPEVLIVSLDRAMADPKLYSRPERTELDRAAAILVTIFERVMDLEAKLANDPITGRPASKIHRFVYTIGKIYGLPLVTAASDDRIAKVLQPTFKFEMCFPAPWSEGFGWS